MSEDRKALLRDAATFHGKLFVDNLKDFAVFWLSLGATLVDLLFRTRLFYRVLRVSQGLDGALDLHGRR